MGHRKKMYYSAVMVKQKKACLAEAKVDSYPHDTFNGHNGLVQGVIQLPGGKRMITCSSDSSLRVWSSEDGSPIGKAWRDGESSVNAIALSPNGKTVASGSDDGAVRLWDIGKGTVIAKWTGHSDRVLSVCWSRNGQRVVSGSADGTARVWDVKSGKTILGPVDTKHETVYAVVYSPDDTMIATGGSGSGDYIKIWDAKRFKLITTLRGHEWAVRCLAWTSAGTLISGSADCSIVTWNTTTWEQLTVFRTDSHVIAIAISPNRRIIASASRNFTVELWDIGNNRKIGLPLQHMSAVECVSFSRNGKSLVTGSANDVFILDVSAIVKEADSNDPLPLSDAPQDPARKSGLDADTRRPKPVGSTLPPGFFGDTVLPTEPLSVVHQPSSRPRTLGGLSSLFRRSHSAFPEDTSHGAPTPFRSLISTLVHFFRHHPPDSEQRPPQVDVSHAQRKENNVHTSDDPPSRTGNILTVNISATPSSVVQQSSGPVSGQQPSSQTLDSITTTHTLLVMPAGTPSPPGGMKRQAGPRTSLGRFLCCNSSDDADDRN